MGMKRSDSDSLSLLAAVCEMGFFTSGLRAFYGLSWLKGSG